jgi:hypothetical protein
VSLARTASGVAAAAVAIEQSSVLALAGTFLLATVTVALTAHLAVGFVRGPVDPVSGLLAGPPPAAVLTAGQWLGLDPLVWIGLFVVVAPLVLWQVYDLERRETLIATVAQYTMVIGIGSMAATLVSG